MGMNRQAVRARALPHPAGVGFAVAAGAAMVAALGCAGPKVTVQRVPQIEQYRVTSIAVLPFEAVSTPQVVRQEGSDLRTPPEVVKSDISMTPSEGARRMGREIASVPPGANQKVARIFTRTLRARGGLTVIPPGESEPAVAALRARDPELSAKEVARRLALDLKADAALQGLLRIYKEREGSKYGADPAIVGFDVMLVASDGRVIWRGSYYEEQRPVTEDIGGFFDRGFGFVTAEDLATYGAEKLVDQFPFGG